MPPEDVLEGDASPGRLRPCHRPGRLLPGAEAIGYQGGVAPEAIGPRIPDGMPPEESAKLSPRRDHGCDLGKGRRGLAWAVGPGVRSGRPPPPLRPGSTSSCPGPARPPIRLGEPPRSQPRPPRARAMPGRGSSVGQTAGLTLRGRLSSECGYCDLFRSAWLTAALTGRPSRFSPRKRRRRRLPESRRHGSPGRDRRRFEVACPVDPRITVGTLSNGLRYHIRRNTKPAG